MNIWDEMNEEKAGVKKKNSMKGSEKNYHACSMEEVSYFQVSDPFLYLNQA